MFIILTKTTYIIAPNDDKKTENLILRVYSGNDNNDKLVEIGEYKTNLKKKRITGENINKESNQKYSEYMKEELDFESKLRERNVEKNESYVEMNIKREEIPIE